MIVNPLLHLEELDIILGSASPRRKDLLSKLDIKFSVMPSHVDEIIPENMKPNEVPEYLSKIKSDDLIKNLSGNYLLITADTVVILNNEILGKPRNYNDALQMLELQSGHIHSVFTGVTIRSQIKSITFSNQTKVKMAPMTRNEIEWYVRQNQVMDKAGSYGIQDWAGVAKIDYLEGSYYNVMGLPTHQVYQSLKEW